MNRSYPLFAALFFLLVAGCGGPPRANATLTEAREAYTAAANDPAIATNAPVALQEAEEALRRAVAEWEDGEDADEVTHYAYVARQRVRIAEERAKLNLSQREVEQVRNERQQVVLEARAAEAEAALTRANELAAEVNELEAELTRRGLVLTLGDVLFDTGQATLKPGAARTVGALVTFLNENPERNVLIEGFTDSVGSDSFNLDLSQRRADAVRVALVERGIAGPRIRTRGYGEAYPVAGNETPAGRQQNRRVEIVISDPQGAIPDRTP
jgi:outer membrane protein OmpA-like peptidoglycan-associated protein